VIERAALLDSDTLSELSRGHARVTEHAAEYLAMHGRLTISAVSVFERLRGYRLALRAGKPFEQQLEKFEAFVACCRVLGVDAKVADRAALIWALLPARRRSAIGDILISATAVAHAMPLVTRNRRDFEAISRLEHVDLELLDWTR
jgi:predicted nucleic acid-binding protein